MFDLAAQGQVELLPDGGRWSSAWGGRWGSSRRVRAAFTQWTCSRWWPMSSQSNKASCVWKKNWALKPPKFIRWHCKASKAPLDLCNMANLAPICSTVSSLMTTTVPVHGDISFSYQMTNCYQIGWLVTFVSVCFGSHAPPRWRMEPSNTEQIHIHYGKAVVLHGHLLLSKILILVVSELKWQLLEVTPNS